MTTAIDNDLVDVMALLNDPETRLWHLIRELYAFGAEHKRLAERLVILEGQLADSTRRNTPQERAKATVRAQKWRKRLRALDDESRTVTGWVSSVWNQLPARQRKDLQSQPNWPVETVAPKLSAALWRMAIEGQEIPGLAPF